LEYSASVLIAHLLQERFFDELRTKQQLGYIVHSSIYEVSPNQNALLFLIQSSVAPPSALSVKIESFLGEFGDYLNNEMGEEEFSSMKQAMVGKYSEKAKNLSEMASRIAGEISNKSYHFALRKVRCVF